MEGNHPIKYFNLKWMKLEDQLIKVYVLGYQKKQNKHLSCQNLNSLSI